MNDFIIFVDGRMVAPDFFNLRKGTAENGSFVRATTDKLVEAPGDIDILEVRASSVVRRHRWQLDGENYDKRDKGMSFLCLPVKSPDSF